MSKAKKVTEHALEELKAWKQAIADMKADGRIVLPSKRGNIMIRKGK